MKENEMKLIANIFTQITGATTVSGFKGIGGKFVRHSLMKFNDDIPSNVKLTRWDTGKSVEVFYNHNIIAGNPEKNFENILSEVKQFFQIHKNQGSIAGGIHLEMTGLDVTECTGSKSCNISTEDLTSRYHTQCDPRLNADQSLELAFLIADTLKEAHK